MKFFHGARRSGPYFEGWYLKHQSRNGDILALIPAFHIDGVGRRSASLQIISNDWSWWLEYPGTQFYAFRDQFHIQLGQSAFDRCGIEINVDQNGLLLQGILKYGPFTPLKSDIMGPFRLFAGMQCSHGVISMGHSLEGFLNLNGELIDFTGGIGYIEADRGRSFPNSYLWTQCVWNGPDRGSLMFAAATIPLPIGGFTGCIGAIFYGGREYRLATYLGAKIEKWSSSGACVRQGNFRLTVEVLEEHAQPLRAPVDGDMERTIHESLSATARYSFWNGNSLLFQHTDWYASFEYSAQ